MKRFLVFPIFVAISFLLLFLETYIEGSFVIFRSFSVGYLFQILPLILERFYLLLLAPGIFVGVSLAVWDLLRNRRNQSSIMRLLPNFFWCLVYATLLIIADAICYLLLSALMPTVVNLNSWYGALLFCSTALLNFTAILWAAIRSITTDDILTPRVLRERSRLH